MTEIFTMIGALGGLITMGIMYYREVRKRADLEKDVAVLAQVVDANKLYDEETRNLEDALESANEYIDILEQKVVDNLDPSELADAINSLFNGPEGGNDPNSN